MEPGMRISSFGHGDSTQDVRTLVLRRRLSGGNIMKYQNPKPTMTRNNMFTRIIPQLGLLLVLTLATSFSGLASQAPPGCNANNLIVNIAKNANNVTNGATVTFTVTIQNPSSADTCDITLGTNGLVFTCPGPDGTPSGVRTTLIPGGTTLCGGPGGFYPVVGGFGPVSFTNACVIFLTNNTSTTSAQAKVDAPGAQLHDNSIQDDPAN